MTPTPTPSPIPSITGQIAISANSGVPSFLIDLLTALVVLIVALVAARYGRFLIVRLFTRRRINLNVATLLGNLLQVIVVSLGVVYALRSLGVDLAGVLTIVGAAGLAISLSMQDLLKNVIAGIYILMEQPFRIGDRISVKEVTGIVQGIELRTTILRTDDNLHVVVPNNTILNEILTNRSASDLKRQIIKVRVKGGSLTEISQDVIELLRDFPDIATSPAPVTAVEGIAEGIGTLRVEFWAQAEALLSITAQVVEALRARFPDAGVTVA
ncbi:MAG: mechanosensitive ion channel family protein [Chloroflexia bacterium]